MPKLQVHPLGILGKDINEFGCQLGSISPCHLLYGREFEIRNRGGGMLCTTPLNFFAALRLILP